MKRGFVVGVALVACSGGQPAEMMPDPLAQTALFNFALSGQVRSSPYLTRPVVGTSYGQIYLSEDITVAGPRSGAMGFEEVDVALDLADGGSDAGFTTVKLPPGHYTYLAFIDTNDSGIDVDKGDVATLPTTNAFEIVDGGSQLDVTIVYDLIYNN